MTTSPTPRFRRSMAALLMLLGSAALVGGCDRRTPTTDPASGGTGSSPSSTSGSTGVTGTSGTGSTGITSTTLPASAASR